MRGTRAHATLLTRVGLVVRPPIRVEGLSGRARVSTERPPRATAASALLDQPVYAPPCSDVSELAV
jgi:hypothetical protein